MSLNVSQQKKRAEQMVERFVRRFEPSYRLLAYHAALPLVLTPELVNYLRVQFLRGQVPWVAEVDLLLSDLCRQVGYELYAMDTAVRAYLLEQMKQELGEERMQEVARLLISYVNYLDQNNPYISPKELQAQQWAAMVFLKQTREQVVREITEAFEKSGASTTSKGLVNAADLARLAKITQELAPQLSKYPNLLDYANLVTKLIARDQTVKAEDLRHYEILDKRLGLPEDLIPDELKERRKLFLEERMAMLSEDYATILDQINITLDAADRVRLQRKAESILQELEEVVELELAKLEAQTSDENLLNLIQKIQKLPELPRIDFTEAKYIVKTVFNRFHRNYGAAIFLLEDVLVMAGELLVDFIREILETNGEIVQISISFSCLTTNRQSDFLRTLGAYLAITQKVSSTEKEYSDRAIDKICDVLQNRTVVFLKIHLGPILDIDIEDFLSWFVHVFWANLISRIRLTIEVRDLRKVRCVAVITSDTSLPPDYISSSDLCTIENFDPSKILKIPLHNWKEADIREWLKIYSGLPLPGYKIDLMAKQIYLKSGNGIPRMVIHCLREELEELVVEESNKSTRYDS